MRSSRPDGTRNIPEDKMKNAHPFWLPALILCLWTLPGAAPAAALAITPFQTFNQSPVVQIYGLPAPGQPEVLPSGRAALGLTTNLASNYVEEDTSRESLILDGETYRFDFRFRYGLPGNFEIAADLPLVSQQEGFLDGFIEGWHDFFHLPQGGRDQAPKNRLLYNYTRDGKQEINVDRAATGLGDIRLEGSWQFYLPPEGRMRRAALHAGLKLPTGDSANLFGSGSTDLAMWVTADNAWSLSRGHAAVYGSGGALFLTDGDVLPGMQRNVVGFGSLGVGWSPLASLAFKVQVDGHTPFYRDSALSELDGSSLQLTIGGTIGFLRTMALDLGVSEDVVVNTSPDVVFHIALNNTF
jgi:hypothetical protein